MRSVVGLALLVVLFQGAVVSRCALAQSATNPAGESGAATQPTLVTSTSQPSAPGIKEIQTMLAKVVEAGTSKGDFDTLISFLAKPDRDRLADVQTKSWSDLDGRIDQFRKDWQAKYGEDFKCSDKQSIVFNDQRVHITLKEEPAPAQPVPATTSATTIPATMPTTAEFARSTSKSATVQIGAAAPGKVSAILPLVNEGTLVPSWRIEIPNDLDGQKIHDNLLKHLTMLGDEKANWSTDVTEAYEAVSQHVLAALVESGGKK